ncbi:GDSL-type esterase/lipase family protein [Ewingella americana]|uniref:Phage tail fiber protein n=2 Tax=Ewingella americana TaxID=41202 RepID=A0A085GBQ4_EWIA3|nr:GDSL-type esterase/lipase family protein [Ewingella americana]KAA8729866.1 SGNH/GDSL hydrolase family protein [Ewingella americana]KFC81149.1 phage tail fiber protein [Ewingella americana ATCC 33852]STQ44534.1 GDSL-like Lipase/Acylhydrolase [Ewingella americana]
MATTPTSNPIPSEAPQDLKFNAGKIDEFVTSDSQYYIDRFRVNRRTINGINFDSNQAILNYGYITKDSFEDGSTLSLANECLRWKSNGEYYRWDGTFPKVVPAGATPDSAGGVGKGKWVGVGDGALRSALKGPAGTDLIKGTKNAGNAVSRSLTDILSDRISIYDFGGKDDFDGTNTNSATNNRNAFAAYFSYLNSIGGGDLCLKKTLGGTGKYFISGDDATQANSPVRIVADEGVSIHLTFSGGPENSPLVKTGLKSNIQIPIHYLNFGFGTFIGVNVQKQLGEILPTLNNGDGVYTIPVSLSGNNDFRAIRLSNINATISPTSTASDSIVIPGGGVPTAAVTDAKNGEEVLALISSPPSGVFFAGVITSKGYAYFAQDSGTQLVKLVDSTEGMTNILSGTPYALMNQQRDNFNNAIVSVKVTSARSFSMLVNGLVIGSYTTRSSIQGVCFGAENINDNISVSQMTKIVGQSFAGSKPLKLIVVGDSISDTSVQYSHAKYLQMILGSAGINIAEINNIATSGENAAQQYSKLQSVGSGYDICMIQIGVNDVQGSTSFSSFVSTIKGMVNYAKSIGAQPIVGIPTSFYSKAEASANGQSGGQNTLNNNSLHTYRALLIRAVSEAGGLLNMEPMKSYGAMTAKWLSLTPYAVSDSIVVDNIHPSPYGSMLLAQGWARSIIGYLCRPNTTNSESFESMPTGWLSSGFGLIAVPEVKGREFSGAISLHATNNNDGAVAFKLPPSFKVEKVKTFPVTGMNASGLPSGVCNMYVGTNGNCYFFNIASGTTQISLDGVKI